MQQNGDGLYLSRGWWQIFHRIGTVSELTAALYERLRRVNWVPIFVELTTVL